MGVHLGKLGPVAFSLLFNPSPPFPSTMAMMHPRSIYPVLATCTHSSASPSTSSAVARLGALSLTRHISSSPVSAASARPIDPSMSAGYLGHPVRPFSAPRGPGGFGKTGGKTRDRARMTEEDAKREFQSWCQTTGSEFKWPKPYVRNWLGGTRVSSFSSSFSLSFWI